MGGDAMLDFEDAIDLRAGCGTVDFVRDFTGIFLSYRWPGSVVASRT